MHSLVLARPRGSLLRLAAAAALAVALSAGARSLPAAQAAHAPGAVYTETNQVTGNQVAIFTRGAGGALTAAGTVASGGNGNGAGLGSQGAVALSEDRDWLFAVNAGSNSVSAFAVRPGGLELKATASSGGITPISLTVHDHVVYVLNAGDNTISGLRAGEDGSLTPIPGSTQPLSAGAAGPTEVQFRPDGRVLLVTEKTSNTLDTFGVDDGGRADPVTSHAAGGTGAFGFAFAGHDLVVVSDSGSDSASSYRVSATGGIDVETASTPNNGQAAPCWLVVTRNNRLAYTANAGSGTISGYRIGHDGQLSNVTANGITGNTGATSHPTDEALSPDSDVLYVLTNGTHSISAFHVAEDGTLSPLAGASGLAGGFVGLAAS